MTANLYDYQTGENLGVTTDEHSPEVDTGRPFLILWQPDSPLHGRTLDDDRLPRSFQGARQVIAWGRDAHLAPFNGRNVWQVIA